MWTCDCNCWRSEQGVGQTETALLHQTADRCWEEGIAQNETTTNYNNKIYDSKRMPFIANTVTTFPAVHLLSSTYICYIQPFGAQFRIFDSNSVSRSDERRSCGQLNPDLKVRVGWLTLISVRNLKLFPLFWSFWFWMRESVESGKTGQSARNRLESVGPHSRMQRRLR